MAIIMSDKQHIEYLLFQIKHLKWVISERDKEIKKLDEEYENLIENYTWIKRTNPNAL